MIAAGAAGLCVIALGLSTATTMPNPAGPHWDDGLTFWDDGSLWSDDPFPAEPTPFLPTTPIPLNTPTTMQPWEITKQRAILSLTVWTQQAPTLKIGGLGKEDLEAWIAEFEGVVQDRAVKQDNAVGAYRAQQATLQKIKLLGTKVPQMMEGHLNTNELLMKDLKQVYAVSPRTEGTILERGRMLFPLWVRANAALAAMTPPQDPIKRLVQGIEQTAVMFKALLDGYTGQVQTTSDKAGLLKTTKKNLEELDEKTDKLNKDWYKVMKASYDPGSAAYEALSTIPTEGGTPAPDTIEIDTVLQGGEDGLHVEVEYESGGGGHATTKLIKWMVVGVDADFIHSEPLTAEGNEIGPFTVGQVVTLMTEVTNSSGTRNSAPRTITIDPPIV